MMRICDHCDVWYLKEGLFVEKGMMLKLKVMQKQVERVEINFSCHF